MLFGKYINKYYLRYALFFIIGIIALVTVDIAQLEVPELFGKLIDDIDKNTLTMETLTAIVKATSTSAGDGYHFKKFEVTGNNYFYNPFKIKLF